MCRRLDDRLVRVCWRHATDVCDVACLRHAGHCDCCVEPPHYVVWGKWEVVSSTRAGARGVLQMCQDAVAMACRTSCAMSALCGIRQMWGRLDDRLGGACWRHATSIYDVACLRHAGHCDCCVEPHTMSCGVNGRSCLRHGP